MSFGLCGIGQERMVHERQAPSLQLRNVHAFNPLARPLGFAEKREARFDARIVEETTYRQATMKFSPPMPLDKRGDDCFQRNAV